MEINSFLASLEYIKPELIITVLLFLVILFDLFYSDNVIIPYLSLIGILVSLAYVITDFHVKEPAFTLSSSKAPLLGIDPIGAFFKIIVLLSSVFVLISTILSSEVEKLKVRRGEFYTLILGMILGMMFLVSAVDLIMIYVAVELMSLSSYVLAGFIRLRDRSGEAGLKYVIYGSVSSGIMLFGISLLYGITGSTNLIEINNYLAIQDVNYLTLALTIIMIFVGIGFKISAVPFHFWTPDVYEGAPITITSFLSVASKAAGFMFLIRFIFTGFVNGTIKIGYWNVLPVFDWQMFLIIIGVSTMTVGNFSALWQDNLKRMLAYSSIAHAGYMLVGIAVLSNQGLLAVMIYLFVYLFMNLGAFLVVMLFADKLKSENIDDFKGLGFTSPFLAFALSIFLISLTGLPPTAGFITKLYLFFALVDANLLYVAVVALLNTVVSLYFYVRVLKHMYLSKPTENTPKVQTSFSVNLLLVILMFPIILFGVYFTPLLNFAKACFSFIGN
jgi:NADH-quinone oxidoreductase subunit N